MPTLVRLFGTAAGRALHTHARGHDPRTVRNDPLPKSLSADRAFDEDILDPATHRRALLDLVEEIAGRLRDSRQAAGGLALSVRYADRTSSTRSRSLPEATAHTRPLTTAAYDLYTLLALQRARVRGISLRAQDLRPLNDAPEQLSLDAGDDRARAVEAVADQARARYGPGALRPATLATTKRTSAGIPHVVKGLSASDPRVNRDGPTRPFR
ncbi:hypothetical protein ACIQWN_37595 [Streptomyces vinaceus]|uniref:DinB/UmuC family translesion DNA polymerase n=1 Tax=Streptomyces vinaceus TaxID=1960 RepID=UPI0037FDC1D3